jgi:hypothetical protein
LTASFVEIPMNNTLQLALLALTLTEQILAAQAQIYAVVKQAQAEGRDVTDEEVAAAKAVADLAYQNFLSRFS